MAWQGIEAIKKTLSKNWWLLLVVWLVIPLFVRSAYIINVLILVAIFTVLTQSIDFVMGVAGQFQLGQMAFFGVGAYVTTILMMNHGFSFWETLPFAFIGAGIAGLIVGLPSLRVSGDYLGLVTFGFGIILLDVFTNWTSVTMGPMGIPGIPTPTIFAYSINSKASFFYLATVFAAFSWFVLARLNNSKLGLQLFAVNADERCADILGVRSGRLKLLTFVISGGFAGLAGSLFATYLSFISPASFTFDGTLIVLSMLVVGGMGNLLGCAIGAAILEIGPEAFRFLGEFRLMLYGLLIIIMVIYRPLGIWGKDRRKRNAICLTAARGTP